MYACDLRSPWCNPSNNAFRAATSLSTTVRNRRYQHTVLLLPANGLDPAPNIDRAIPLSGHLANAHTWPNGWYAGAVGIFINRGAAEREAVDGGD